MYTKQNDDLLADEESSMLPYNEMQVNKRPRDPWPARVSQSSAAKKRGDMKDLAVWWKRPRPFGLSGDKRILITLL